MSRPGGELRAPERAWGDASIGSPGRLCADPEGPLEGGFCAPGRQRDGEWRDSSPGSGDLVHLAGCIPLFDLRRIHIVPRLLGLVVSQVFRETLALEFPGRLVGHPNVILGRRVNSGLPVIQERSAEVPGNRAAFFASEECFPG